MRGYVLVVLRFVPVSNLVETEAAKPRRLQAERQSASQIQRFKLIIVLKMKT